MCNIKANTYSFFQSLEWVSDVSHSFLFLDSEAWKTFNWSDEFSDWFVNSVWSSLIVNSCDIFVYVFWCCLTANFASLVRGSISTSNCTGAPTWAWATTPDSATDSVRLLKTDNLDTYLAVINGFKAALRVVGCPILPWISPLTETVTGNEI